MPTKIRRPAKRRDAAESVFVSRQLEEVRTKVYEQRLPQFKARTLIPVNNTEDPGLEVIRYRTYDQVGVAKFIASYSDDLPRVDISGREFTAQVKTFGDAYGYNRDEINKARREGVDLEQRKANAARRAAEQLIDQVARIGDADLGLLGLLNQPNALVMTIPNGASASPLWSSKTAAEMLKDLVALSSNSYRNTNQVETANTILLPFSSLELIGSTFVPNTTETVLSVFEKINRASETPITRIASWADLETAGAGGTRRAVAYRNDPDALELRIPEEFNQLEPEKRNLEWVVDCTARIGGVLAFYPMTITYADGI